MKKYRCTRALALLLIIALLAALLTGCDLSKYIPENEVKPGETVSSDSKWINSSIVGAIDEQTQTVLKDDFYTAVNRDWLLNTALPEGADTLNFGTTIGDVLWEKTRAIMYGEGVNSPGAVTLTETAAAGIKHERELIRTFFTQAGDWEKRDSLGIEPIVPYITAIREIGSMADMTAYLLNKNGRNFLSKYPITFGVSEPIRDRSTYTLAITSDASLLLGDSSLYSNIDISMVVGIVRKELANQRGTYMLERLGYSPAEVRSLMHKCYRFEARLAEFKRDEITMQEKDIDNAYTMAELGDLAGNYPLIEILKQYGMESAKSITVTNPDYVRKVGKLYTDAYLEEMKAYYIVHTAIEAMPLLDRAAFEQYIKFLELSEAKEPAESDADGGSPPPIPDQKADDDAMTEKEREDRRLLTYFIQPYLGRAIDDIYAATYCTEKEKADIMDMIHDILSYYSDMLMAEDWLSEETRLRAVQKIDNMAVHAVYPDELFDYSTLTLDGEESLVDNAAAIYVFMLKQSADGLDEPIDRSKWGYEMSNLTVNAFYNPGNNSINILAGILADGSLYDENAKREENLAKIGTIIGHEISHAFDNTGSLYDDYGRKEDWWTQVDKGAFRLKASRLKNHYSALTPYPGAISYDGSNVQGEAIADMGGVKCILGLAAKDPDFDYDAFFTAYAGLWKEKSTYGHQASVVSDEHPLSFMRVNVTLQQFDKFYETYGIEEGDGMYLAPEKRICIW